MKQTECRVPIKLVKIPPVKSVMKALSATAVMRLAQIALMGKKERMSSHQLIVILLMAALLVLLVLSLNLVLMPIVSHAPKAPGVLEPKLYVILVRLVIRGRMDSPLVNVVLPTRMRVMHVSMEPVRIVVTLIALLAHLAMRAMASLNLSLMRARHALEAHTA